MCKKIFADLTEAGKIGILFMVSQDYLTVQQNCIFLLHKD